MFLRSGAEITDPKPCSPRVALWTCCRWQAPAAFGLVSFLMHAGLERNRIRKHLLVFALAAPVLAMLTFVGLSQVNIRKSPVGAAAGGLHRLGVSNLLAGLL